jgi:hypothetical protein
MKKILLLLALSLMSFSTVSADEETTRDISGLKAKHAEIKVRVEAGEITKEEARSE